MPTVVRLYCFNLVTQFTVLTEKVKDHILLDGTYVNKICTGAAVMYAHLALDVSQKLLWRDYTHLSDYGRLLSAYAMYIPLVGVPITEVVINSVAAELRHSLGMTNGDMVVTEEMKQIILKAANHSLEDPWSVPAVRD